jgi:hypothetical protein
MLAISSSPASAGASSSAWAATGSPDPVVALGFGLLSSAGTRGSATLVVCCVIRDTSSSTVGTRLRLLSVGSPNMSQSDDGISCDNSEFSCQHAILQDKYPTTLLEEITSWDVVSVTFNFLATRLRTTLRGLLGGAGRLASRLVGGSLKSILAP